MYVLNKKEFTKLEYLIGFVNNIIDIVSNPDEELDFNTKDCSVYALGYGVENANEIKFSTLESSTIKDWKDTLAEVEDKVKENTKIDFTKYWEEIRK